MTQALKEEVIYTWTLAGELHRYLELKIVDNVKVMSSEFVELLEQYQNAVIMVGKILEQCMSEQERQEIISLLEQYCEEIYLLSQATNSIQNYYIKSGAVWKKYTSILEKLDEIPVRKTALFLPYKFSMWDSMESIYLAAKEDAEWDAFVMPIPYGEYNQEGKIEKWIYEGDAFVDIPIVSYKNYNISVHKPEVIYIHNPYDNYNRVTTVASEFYTSELKKHCETLVYVPYFFTGKRLPDIHLSLPTYQYMDYIVLPSKEAVKQMEEYVPAEKLLVLGSPKIDRMIRMQQLKEMPKEWKERIRGRKTVLYNVSLNAMLNQRFQVILKMRAIFNYFKGQSDLVLWWRPHPLMKSTLKSMCPELVGAYEAMERSFLLENIGIYDTTPDSNMAVAATDAFLGDYSSICSLYGIMGKPIFLTDNTILEEPNEEERRQLWISFPGLELHTFGETYPIRDKENNMYFYSLEYRILGKMSKDMSKVEIIRQFDSPCCKVQVFYTDDWEKMEIHFYPADKNRVGKIYHVAQDTWSETDRFVGVSLALYFCIVQYQGQWIMTPGKNSEFVYINEETGEMSCYNSYEDVLRPYRQIPGEKLFNGMLQIDECIYLMAYRVNKLLEFNLANKSWRYYDIGTGKDRFSNFWFDGRDFWFAAWDGTHVTRWNKRTGDCKTFSDMPQGFHPFLSAFANADTPAFSGIYELGTGEIFLPPNTANMYLKLNMTTGEIKQWNLNLPYEEGQRKSSLYNMISNYGAAIWADPEHILMQSSYDGSVFIVDINTGEWERKQCMLSEKDYKRYSVPMERQADRDGIDSPYYYREKGLTCTLKDMMDYFASGADMQEERQYLASTEGIENADGTCGTKIHEHISNIL